MNAGILTLAALVVAAAPSLLLEVFDRTRQQELRVLTGKDVPAVQHRTALRWTTAGAWAVLGLTALGHASGVAALRGSFVLFSVAFLTLVATAPIAWVGMQTASRDLHSHAAIALRHESRTRIASLTPRAVADSVSLQAQLVPFVVSLAGCGIVAMALLHEWSGSSRPMLPVGFSAVGLTLCGLYRAWMGAEAAAPVVPEHVGASESDLTRRARIRSLFVAQVWLAVVYATIGSALAATDWGDPAGRVCGNLLILSGGILGLWACARAMTSNHSVPVVVGVVRQRTSSHGE